MSWLHDLFGKNTSQPTGDSPVDAVLYLASLAAQRQEIDPLLDGLREVTARIRDDNSLTAQDELKLAEVYSSLEAYLVSNDPLRSFDAPTLHQKVAARFQPTTKHQAFWHKIGMI